MDSALMLKRWLVGGRWVIGGLLASTVAACSAGSPSEQIVRRNLPAEQSATQDAPGAAAPIAAKPKSTVERASASDKSITSQEVERELNRLEAELR
jgi:hypothetical protein